jgi:hypothetical protein
VVLRAALVSRRFKGSAAKRTRRRGPLRNVAVALGNRGSPEAAPVLADALSDAEPLVRGHAAWALGRIGTAGAMRVLRGRAEVEEDEWVREEIRLALASLTGPRARCKRGMAETLVLNATITFVAAPMPEALAWCRRNERPSCTSACRQARSGYEGLPAVPGTEREHGLVRGGRHDAQVVPGAEHVDNFIDKWWFAHRPWWGGHRPEVVGPAGRNCLSWCILAGPWSP